MRTCVRACVRSCVRGVNVDEKLHSTKVFSAQCLTFFENGGSPLGTNERESGPYLAYAAYGKPSMNYSYGANIF